VTLSFQRSKTKAWQDGRAAVLADIHGNLPALNAVLGVAAAADAVVLLGDIALGPMPAKTLDVLAGGLGAWQLRVGDGDRLRRRGCARSERHTGCRERCADRPTAPGHA
jgi:hypothetical protein